MILISLEMETGSISRYECAPGIIRLTHAATAGRRIEFTQAVVDEFRYTPHDQFKVDPPPRPTNPPAAAGGVNIIRGDGWAA